MKSDMQKARLLSKMVELMEKLGRYAVTKELLASACAVSPSLVTHYFGNFEGFRHDALVTGLRRGSLSLSAQVMALGTERERKLVTVPMSEITSYIQRQAENDK